jgi:hypothetical protein
MEVEMSDVAATTVTAAATLLGAGLGSYTTYKLTRPYRQEAALNRIAAIFESRLPVYLRQWKLTEYGPEEAPRNLPLVEREALVQQMRDWYYRDGGGLLISGRAFNRWRSARDELLRPEATPGEIWKSLTALRTALKIDLGVRQLEEATVQYAEPEEDRWSQ